MRNSPKRKKTAVSAVVIFSFIFSALPFGCRTVKEVRVIKLGHGLDPTHPVHLAMEFLAGRVAEKSSGRMRIDVYPSEQLGTERECLELLQIGSLGMTKVSCSVIEGFVPEMGVLSLPYLFRNEEHRFKVLEAEIGRELLRAGEKYWLHGLCYYDAGTRSFYTKDRPILNPDDLAGLKIRTQESPTSIKMVQALGGSATPIAWGELYSALQQGVVDGAENNPPSFYLSRHYEVCKFYSLDEHTGVPDVLVISTEVWNGLPPEFQKILQVAADESALYQKKLWKEATRRALEEVQQAGVEIYYPEKESFIRMTESIYEEYRDEPAIYGLIQRIRAVR
jgi:tripartite ATP-independent transporter DctP family solute receptor